MPINAHPEYFAAEKEYLLAQSLEEKIEKLKKLISLAPHHKGAENLRAQLKTRLKKFQEQLIKSKKSGKISKQGIKKEEMQAIIIGKTNSGKSSLLKLLTSALPKIANNKFTTQEPIVGILQYLGTQIQLIEIPPIEGEFFDKNLLNTADTILILITNLEELKEIEKLIEKAKGKRIIILNKSDTMNDEQKRRISATLQSRKYNFILISAITHEGINELKEKIFNSFDKLRIFTKEPGKEKSQKPVIMKPNSTVLDDAEKILKGFSKKVKQTKIWGPSSKFGGQIVGLNHKLKDMDIVEFKTR